jgi:hypothetical protein
MIRGPKLAVDPAPPNGHRLTVFAVRTGEHRAEQAQGSALEFLTIGGAYSGDGKASKLD